MFTLSKKFIRLPDKLLKVKRIFSEERVKDIEGVKKWLDTDTVMKKDGILYFCNEIEEAQILEDDLAR